MHDVGPSGTSIMSSAALQLCDAANPYRCDIPAGAAPLRSGCRLVHLVCVGETGNHLWQLAFGLYVASKYNYLIKWFTPHKLGRELTEAVFAKGAEPSVFVGNGSSLALYGLRLGSCGGNKTRWEEWPKTGSRFCDTLLQPIINGDLLHIQGFFQTYRIVQPYKHRIRKLFQAPSCEPECPGQADLVVHLRSCSDAAPSQFQCQGVAPRQTEAYLLAVIAAFVRESTDAGLIWVVTTPSCANSSLVLSVIDKLDSSVKPRVRVRSNRSAVADFAFLAAASHVVLTMERIAVSTFGWWAAFLNTKAHTVHMPLNACVFDWWRGALAGAGGVVDDPSQFDSMMMTTMGNTGFLGRTQPLVVYDEPRYVYHDVLQGRFFGRYASNATHEWIRMQHINKGHGGGRVAEGALRATTAGSCK